MAIPLFVYGTLKRSGPVEARSLLANAKLISTGSIAGTLYDLGDYPGVVRNPGDTRVFGELYEFEDENANRALALLDRYEGSQFVRRRAMATLKDGSRRLA